MVSDERRETVRRELESISDERQRCTSPGHPRGEATDGGMVGGETCVMGTNMLRLTLLSVPGKTVLIAKQDEALLLRGVIRHRTSEMNCNCN